MGERTRRKTKEGKEEVMTVGTHPRRLLLVPLLSICAGTKSICPASFSFREDASSEPSSDGNGRRFHLTTKSEEGRKVWKKRIEKEQSRRSLSLLSVVVDWTLSLFSFFDLRVAFMWSQR